MSIQGGKKRNGDDDTHTEGDTTTVSLGFYVYMI